MDCYFLLVISTKRDIVWFCHPLSLYNVQSKIQHRKSVGLRRHIKIGNEATRYKVLKEGWEHHNSLRDPTEIWREGDSCGRGRCFFRPEISNESSYGEVDHLNRKTLRNLIESFQESTAVAKFWEGSFVNWKRRLLGSRGKMVELLCLKPCW